MKLFVGIDVSSQDMKACIMGPDGETLGSPIVQNNLTGASYLRDQIMHFAKKLMPQDIQIGLESTSVYSWHPAMFFHEDQGLQGFHTKVYTINPKLIKKFKEAYVDLDKNDHIDAWIIADRLRFGRLPLTSVMQEQYIALQRLTRMRYPPRSQSDEGKTIFLTTLVL